MAAGYNDSWQLSQDATLQGRIQQSLVAQCGNIAAEGWTKAFHRERARQVSLILSSPQQLTNFVTLFTNTVTVNAVVLADATVNGTVAITTANRAAQAALITDAHIDNAISAQFDAFIVEPGN